MYGCGTSSARRRAQHLGHLLMADCARRPERLARKAVIQTLGLRVAAQCVEVRPRPLATPVLDFNVTNPPLGDDTT